MVKDYPCVNRWERPAFVAICSAFQQALRIAATAVVFSMSTYTPRLPRTRILLSESYWLVSASDADLHVQVPLIGKLFGFVVLILACLATMARMATSSLLQGQLLSWVRNKLVLRSSHAFSFDEVVWSKQVRHLPVCQASGRYDLCSLQPHGPVMHRRRELGDGSFQLAFQEVLFSPLGQEFTQLDSRALESTANRGFECMQDASTRRGISVGAQPPGFFGSELEQEP